MISQHKKSIQILKRMQHPSGLFSASAKSVKTGYNRAWIRDNIYSILGLESAQKNKEIIRTMRALLDIFLKHEYKIDYAIKEKPRYAWQYIHARYDPETMNEIWEEWGNKQNDAVGAFLFKLGQLENKGIKIIRNQNDLRIIQKLVNYLGSIEYWHDLDNGMWEENEEVHASSVGACLAGLKEVSKIIGVEVAEELIRKGQQALNQLLPHESVTKKTDLALLSLIYPYDIVTPIQRDQILKNIETQLVRPRGVIRYHHDHYYNPTGKLGDEAEWTMGLCWLAIIYKQLNQPRKYAYYMRKIVEKAINQRGELPELYYSKTNKHNQNSPLAWSQSLFLVAVMS